MNRVIMIRILDFSKKFFFTLEKTNDLSGKLFPYILMQDVVVDHIKCLWQNTVQNLTEGQKLLSWYWC